LLPEEILKEAASLVAGQRAEQHGDYTTLHERIADLWSSYLKFKVSPEQVALCMVLVKIARDEVGNENPDDAIDAASYVALWGALKSRVDPPKEKPIQTLFKK
jgi:hypothetical protein